MHKDKYKNNYIAVLRAIKMAEEEVLGSSNIRLYLTKKNGLLDIPFSEMRSILVSMEDEELISIVEHPRMSVLLLNNNPLALNDIETLPGMLQTLISNKDKKPRNYYTIKINRPTFSYVYDTYLIPLYLLSAIPSGEENNKKYKVLRKMIDLLVSAGLDGIDSSTVAMSFIKVVDNRTKQLRKLTIDDYKQKKRVYDDQIENRLRTLRTKLKPEGYTISFEKNKLKIVQTSPR